MKNEEKDLVYKAQRILLDALKNVPSLKAVSTQKDGERVDFIIRLRSGGKSHVLLVEVRNSGQPRVAREAINQLVRYRNAFRSAHCVFMAPYISPRSAEICINDDIGYLDFAGNSRLSFGPFYIEKSGNPNPFIKKRELVSLFSPKASRVLRVLLNNPDRKWKMRELADESRVSIGQVANVKKRLLDREWIADREGIALIEPWALLDEWTKNYNYRKNGVVSFYSLKPIVEIEAEIAEKCKEKGAEFALTGFSGAARFSPAVRYNRVMAYVGGEVEELASSLNFKEVASGANVVILKPHDYGVFLGSAEVDEIKVVSPIQIYLDLTGIKGRGEEAAEALLREVIKPKWTNP